MTCKECNTRNPIGNKFCRECGSKIVIPEGSLAAEEAERAENERKAERAAVLLADAHLLAEQGKYTGAIPIVEEAIALVPFSGSAYNLLVTLYEHTDQMERAVAAQTRVVEMQPEAEAEGTRLERLKRGERTSPPPARISAGKTLPTLRSTDEKTENVPILPQWAPYAIAAFSGAAIFLGYIAMTPRNAPAAQIKPASSTAPMEVANIPNGLVPDKSVVTVTPNASPAPQRDPFVSLDPTRQALQAEAARRSGTAQPSTTPNTAAVLPSAKNLGALRPPSVTTPAAQSAGTSPVVVSISKDNPGRSDEDAPLPTIAAGPPSATSPAGAPQQIAAAPPSPEPSRPSGGYMRIQVNAPQQQVAAAPTANNTPADMDGDPLRRARTLQRMERYNDAIGAYREAIAAGAAAGDAYQNIAMCYQHEGDNTNAKSAYQQAISAYEAQIKSGRNASAALRGKQSCEAALEVLGG